MTATTPNTVLYALVTAAGLTALTAVILAANAAGRRRERRRAWPKGDS